jgi:hypothetical protein
VHHEVDEPAYANTASLAFPPAGTRSYLRVEADGVVRRVRVTTSA